MTAKTVEVAFTAVAPGKRQSGRTLVVRELPLTINLNGQELVTTLCSPADLEYLVAGILYSEGIIQNKEDIGAISVNLAAGTAEASVAGCVGEKTSAFKPLVASGGGKGPSSYGSGGRGFDTGRSETRMGAVDVLTLMSSFLHYSDAYQETHGMHSAALCDGQKIIVFSDDIGRHNALDKVFGRCLLDGIPIAGGIIITSGRISSEILLKVARRGIAVLISKAPPTDTGIKLAAELGVTLVVARNAEIALYSHPWRVI
jgi:FdhD protein